MAGNYVDVPSWRFAYDRDGAQAYILNNTNPPTSVLGQLDQTMLNGLNDEGTDLIGRGPVAPGDNGWTVVIFPELRDIDAVYACGAVGPEVHRVQVSADTTNGIDGTWTELLAEYPDAPSGRVSMRSAIQSFTALSEKAIRVSAEQPGAGSSDGRLSSLHLYGEIAPGENPHRLQLIKAAVDTHIDPAEFDWGNVPRSSTADKTFRVKNLSPSLTAQSIRVAMETLTDAAPSVPGQHTLSYAGGSFLAQVNIGDLAPGAISDVITLRRITPSNAELSLWWMRVFAEATTWV